MQKHLKTRLEFSVRQLVIGNPEAVSMDWKEKAMKQKWGPWVMGIWGLFSF